MNQQNQTRIIRKPEVIQLLGISKTTLHYRIKDGLLPQPFPLGANSVGWLNTEIRHIQAVIVSGASTSELKAAVKEIVSQRKEMA
ncbi:AlpA family phage regulatory protein [Psychrosphaera sp. B3R10]|uniref:helix-turn-helix transcriptional regulator n=1 Tax=unclassified Psychrosphaera TaxID=2641570 RepID=UPI001C0A0C6C|nr:MULTISPECIES: AlpA family phage regulatory protein [unclassified Psychrosphaera]MBU2883010.1 AlpA family phage regulatory protein [Psychrosphaera sp. I2R16]MBU2991407.1 AlpA family phage regulatory protein [Psychrosphaera sp. B3R10]